MAALPAPLTQNTRKSPTRNTRARTHTHRRVHFVGVPVEKSFIKYSGHVPPEDSELDWFVGLLWRAFPEARSQNELAELVAQAFASDRRPLDKRTVINWLGRRNSPHFRYVLKAIALAGVEMVIGLADPEGKR